MEKPETDYARNLLDLKYHNADAFYQVLTELSIDGFNKVIMTNEFMDLRSKPEFWKRLWRTKFSVPFEEGKHPFDMKERYYRYSAAEQMAEFSYRHTESGLFATASFKEMSKRDRVDYFLDPLEHLQANPELFKIGIEYDDVNFLYMVTPSYIMKDKDVDNLVEKNRGEIVDKWFSLISNQEQLRLTRKLKLDQIVRIPRVEGCNTTLAESALKMKEHEWKEPHFSQEFASAVDQAFKKNCEDLLGFMVKEIKGFPRERKEKVMIWLADLKQKEVDYLMGKLTEFEKKMLQHEITQKRFRENLAKKKSRP